MALTLLDFQKLYEYVQSGRLRPSNFPLFRPGELAPNQASVHNISSQFSEISNRNL